MSTTVQMYPMEPFSRRLSKQLIKQMEVTVMITSGVWMLWKRQIMHLETRILFFIYI